MSDKNGVISMDHVQLKQLANYIHLAEIEKREIKKITAGLYPELTIEDGYLIQEELIRQKIEQGHKIVGLKMGITSEAKMKQMNVNEPIYGFLFDYMIVNDGDYISMSDYIHPKVEPEIGFILKHDLEGPHVTLQDVVEATEYVFPAIEIIDSRYENFDFTLPDVVADNTSASGAVFGTHLKSPENLELDVVGVTLLVNGEIKASGAGAAVLDHPANSIAKLANMLYKKDQKVKAGQPILSGGVTEAVRITSGDFITVKIEGIGDVSFSVKK
jgi:2-oxo-3-hexenedioate decarboxylase